MSDPITLELGPTKEAYRAAMARLYELGLQQVLGNEPERVDHDTGEVVERRYVVSFAEIVEDKTLRQLRFYFGPVLKQIAEQAAGGWTRDAWHEAMKREELGYEIVKVMVAGRKKPTVYRRLRSVRDLTIKQMSEYIDRVIASATTALGVTFVFDLDEREAVRYRRPARKAKAVAQEEATC